MNKKGIKIKLIDEYGFEKIIVIKIKAHSVVYHLIHPRKNFIEFRLHDVPKKGLPIFKQVISDY